MRFALVDYLPHRAAVRACRCTLESSSAPVLPSSTSSGTLPTSTAAEQQAHPRDQGGDNRLATLKRRRDRSAAQEAKARSVLPAADQQRENNFMASQTSYRDPASASRTSREIASQGLRRYHTCSRWRWGRRWDASSWTPRRQGPRGYGPTTCSTATSWWNINIHDWNESPEDVKIDISPIKAPARPEDVAHSMNSGEFACVRPGKYHYLHQNVINMLRRCGSFEILETPDRTPAGTSDPAQGGVAGQATSWSSHVCAGFGPA